jgi:hypothetical protein
MLRKVLGAGQEKRSTIFSQETRSSVNTTNEAVPRGEAP